MFRESSTLLTARRIVIVIVKAALTYSDGSSGGKLSQAFDVPRRFETLGVVGMHSGRKPHETGKCSGHGHGCMSGAEDIPSAAAGSDADDRISPVVPCPFDYLAAVAVERLVGEVRVAVDEPFDEPFDIPSFRGHFLSIQSNTGLAM